MIRQIIGKKRGFMLVELVVSLVLFMLVYIMISQMIGGSMIAQRSGMKRLKKLDMLIELAEGGRVNND